MKKPPERYWTQDAIDTVAARLDLQNEPWMQDWAYEVAEPGDLDRYLSLFEEMPANDDVRFVLADVILQAFEMLEDAPRTDARWPGFIAEIRCNVVLHAHQIWYWSAFDVPLQDAWTISPEMRVLSQELL